MWKSCILDLGCISFGLAICKARMRWMEDKAAGNFICTRLHYIAGLPCFAPVLSGPTGMPQLRNPLLIKWLVAEDDDDDFEYYRATRAKRNDVPALMGLWVETIFRRGPWRGPLWSGCQQGARAASLCKATPPVLVLRHLARWLGRCLKGLLAGVVLTSSSRIYWRCSDEGFLYVSMSICVALTPILGYGPGPGWGRPAKCLRCPLRRRASPDGSERND